MVQHIGHREIEKIRKLRGWTQTTLGQKLNITKQAVSKLKQSENISDENVLYNTNNFYENCGVNATNIENVHNPLKVMIEMFERQIQIARTELIEALKNKK